MCCCRWTCIKIILEGKPNLAAWLLLVKDPVYVRNRNIWCTKMYDNAIMDHTLSFHVPFSILNVSITSAYRELTKRVWLELFRMTYWKNSWSEIHISSHQSHQWKSLGTFLNTLQRLVVYQKKLGTSALK